MSPVTGRFGRPYTPSLRATFVNQIGDACDQLGAELQWSSDDWIAEVTLDDKCQHIAGYTFAVNDSAAAELAVDKAATSAVLAAHGVRAVQHRVFTFGDNEDQSATMLIVAAMSLPVVVKPVRSSGGVDVLRARTPEELENALTVTAAKYPCVALSPWISATYEYRVVSVDGSAELVFRKRIGTRNESEWRHSSAYGALTDVVPDSPIRERLASMACDAMTALGLRAGAVDVLEDDHADLHIVEVNDAFSLNHFSQESVENYRLATAAYRTIIGAGFGI